MSNDKIIDALANSTGASRAIVPSPDAVERAAKHYFGGCPVCGETDGYFNIGSEHWFVCDEHKIKWRIGSNLFSDWKLETEAEQIKNAVEFRRYREAEPIRTTWLRPHSAADLGLIIIAEAGDQKRCAQFLADRYSTAAKADLLSVMEGVEPSLRQRGLGDLSELRTELARVHPAWDH